MKSKMIVILILSAMLIFSGCDMPLDGSLSESGTQTDETEERSGESRQDENEGTDEDEATAIDQADETSESEKTPETSAPEEGIESEEMSSESSIGSLTESATEATSETESESETETETETEVATEAPTESETESAIETQAEATSETTVEETTEPHEETKPVAVKVTMQNYQDEIYVPDKIVIVDFYADWCGPCQRLSPILEDIGAERSDIKICKVNVDAEGQLTSMFGIEALPTLLIVQDGEVVERIVGFRTKADLLDIIDSFEK